LRQLAFTCKYFTTKTKNVNKNEEIKSHLLKFFYFLAVGSAFSFTETEFLCYNNLNAPLKKVHFSIASFFANDMRK